MNRGKFIVFEGTDGSGKATQVEMLDQYLLKKKIPHQQIAFPRYTDNSFGKWIKQYLNGEIKKEVTEKVFATAFAEDRKLAKPLIKKWLKDGNLVIADRYVPSSKAHLSAKLDSEKRADFIAWLDNLEYTINRIPKEDLVIFLNVPAEIASQNLESRGIKKDLHEKNLEHLRVSNEIYQSLAKEGNWIVIDCIKNGKMKPKEKIHQEIVDKLGSSL